MRQMASDSGHLHRHTGFVSYLPLSTRAASTGNSLSRSTFLTSRVVKNPVPRASGPLMSTSRLFTPSVFPKLSNLLIRTPSKATESPSSMPQLEGDRGVVLVTGASGRTGRKIIEQLLPQARQIIAQVEPGFEAESVDWASRPEVTIVQSTMRTAEGVAATAGIAREAGVGTVVFAASGGINSCAAVENAAVGILARELSPLIGGIASGDVRPLFEFFGEQGASSVAQFQPVDDVVMGGRSSSTLKFISESGASFARFSGNVTTLGGGGFAQTRVVLGSEEEGVDLSSFDGIVLRVRGAGQSRQYKLGLKDHVVPDAAFQAIFTVAGDDAWQTVRVPFAEFVPMRRGKPVYGDGYGNGTYMQSLNTANVRSLGIVLSLVGDGILKVANVREREGPFQLDVRSIGAYRAAPPRFVLLSAAAVTRPFWGPERMAMDGAVAKITIVELNPGGILGHKLAGENALRRSNISWCVVRSVGLNDSVESGRLLRLGQGDVLSGTMSREDVARGVLATLRAPSAAFKTFELASFPGTMAGGSGEDVSDESFAKLMPDLVDAQYPDKVDVL